MKKSLTIQAVIELHEAIETLRQGVINRSLAYAMKRTKERTKPVWDAIVEMEKPSPVLGAYRKEFEELAKRSGTPDGKGNVKLNNPAQFALDLEALKANHTEALKESMEIEEAVKVKLKDMEEIDLHMADYETLPEQISGLILDGIFPMLNKPKESNVPIPK